MKKLNSNIVKNGNSYNLVKRNNSIAMYALTLPTGKISCYEVFIVKKRKAVSIMNKDYPPMECFPSNEDFGRSAWVAMKRDNAELIFENLTNNLPPYTKANQS